MLPTQRRRCRGGLRVLWQGSLFGLHSKPHCRANGLLATLRNRAGARRQSHSTASGQERAKCAGQRVLLLSYCGAFWRCGGCRVVHIAVTVFDLLHGRLRGGANRSGILVWSGGKAARAGFMTIWREGFVRTRWLARPNCECNIETLSQTFWSDDLSGRTGFPSFSHLQRPAFTLPSGGGPVRP